MSTCSQVCLKRKLEACVQPKSLVFVVIECAEGILKYLSLWAIHVDEFKAEETRVVDKLRLNFQSRAFDHGAAKQVVGFLNLQANPVCLLLDEGKRAELASFKYNVEKCGFKFKDDVSYAWLDAAIPGKRQKSTMQTPSEAMAENDEDHLKRMKARCNINSLATELVNTFDSAVVKVTINKTLDEQENSETLVFVDLETTDLSIRRITEICMVAISREKFLSWNRGSIPRDGDLLQLAVDPGIEIGSMAEVLTKLTRSKLIRSKKQLFSEAVATAVCDFIRRYRGPLCLVAHNGKSFDFSILRKHLRAFPDHLQSLVDVDCCDSLLGFRKRQDKTKVRISQGLADIYQRCYGTMDLPGAHTAEGDVTALMKVVACHPDVLDVVAKEKFVK